MPTSSGRLVTTNAPEVLTSRSTVEKNPPFASSTNTSIGITLRGARGAGGVDGSGAIGNGDVSRLSFVSRGGGGLSNASRPPTPCGLTAEGGAAERLIGPLSIAGSAMSA